MAVSANSQAAGGPVPR